MIGHDLELRVERLGVIMQPSGEQESLGICNPGGALLADGTFALYPRRVGPGNHSVIGRATVQRDRTGRPTGATLDDPIVVQPYVDHCDEITPLETWLADYNGVEDPRVVWVPLLSRYVMTYTAYNQRLGPRIALAESRDGKVWTKLGLVQFASLWEGQENADELRGCLGDIVDDDNKDAVFLSEPVMAPDGTLAWALLHRPAHGARAPGIWVSYATIQSDGDTHGPDAASPLPLRFDRHWAVAFPAQPWESAKIGAGCVLKTQRGWLLIYHGVSLRYPPLCVQDGPPLPHATYSAGAMLLHGQDPRRVLARTREPFLSPETYEEYQGTVPSVVFPTAAEYREGGLDLYYGAADSVICCARITAHDPHAPSTGPRPENTRGSTGHHRTGSTGARSARLRAETGHPDRRGWRRPTANDRTGRDSYTSYGDGDGDGADAAATTGTPDRLIAALF